MQPLETTAKKRILQANFLLRNRYGSSSASVVSARDTEDGKMNAKFDWSISMKHRSEDDKYRAHHQ